MVPTIKAFVVFSLVITGTCLAELDLTPIEDTKDIDGARISFLSFHIDGRTATYRPPHGWSYAGSTSSLRVYCAGEPSADAFIEKIPLSKPVEFDEAQMKMAAEEAVRTLPKGAVNPVLVLQEKNPLKISDRETIQTVVSYIFYGHSMQMSLLDLNMGDMLLRFRLITEKEHFSKMHSQFQSSLFSWNGL